MRSRFPPEILTESALWQKDDVRSLVGWFDDRKSDMVDLLADLVRIETPSRHPEAAGQGLDMIERGLVDLEFEVKRRPGAETAGWLVAEPAGVTDADRGQLIVGHVDTVWPVGTLARMPLRVSSGTLEGPGAYDMKAGLVQMLFSIRALFELGIDPPIPVRVFVNADEEIGSPESTSGLVRLATRSIRAFVTEPSLGRHGALKTSRKGGRRYTVEVRGRSAHAGLDLEAGSNAIAALADVVQKLIVLNDVELGISVNVGMIEGGTQPNVVPESARAVVDVRAATNEDADRVDAAIRAIRPEDPGARATIEATAGRPPMQTTAKSRAMWQTAAAAARLIGFDLQEAHAGGASDGNTTSQLCPTLDGLGAVGDGAHASHEFVEIDRMPERAALLALLLASDPAKHE